VHELSISMAIVGVVLDHADGRQVETVRVRVGALRQIVPDSLTFCWSAVSQRPQLESSELEIEVVPGTVECCDCGRRGEVDEPLLRCPHCGSGMVVVLSGEEFLVTSIEVTSDDAPPDDACSVDVSADDAAEPVGS
jgi:hydrogenase nickel incorporation protein HypA/HybF